MSDILDFSISPLLIVKLAFLSSLLIYIFFAVIVVRQVNNMIKTLDVGYEAALQFVAIAHLLFAVGTFILALIIL